MLFMGVKQAGRQAGRRTDDSIMATKIIIQQEQEQQPQKLSTLFVVDINADNNCKGEEKKLIMIYIADKNAQA